MEAHNLNAPGKNRVGTNSVAGKGDTGTRGRTVSEASQTIWLLPHYCIAHRKPECRYGYGRNC